MGGFQQRSWTPTKRRGPIGAEFSGPGPACVALASFMGSTTNNSEKGRAPSFSFGLKKTGKNESIGPGPGQYNVTGLSAKGKDTPPAISLYSRNKEGRLEMTPAPGDYCPEKSANIVLDNSPKYTFGVKTQIGKPSSTPAPGEYSPEKSAAVLLDQSPKYSFGHKSQIEKPSSTPAPGHYKLERSGTIILGHSPKFSFGLKTPTDRPSDTPAPNVYNIPTALGGSAEGCIKTAPAFSISGRQREFPDDRILTPGPGAYENSNVDVVKPKSPAYSVSSRYQLPSDDLLKPGPGAYSPEKIQLDYPPAHSFGIKHSPFTYEYNEAVY